MTPHPTRTHTLFGGEGLHNKRKQGKAKGKMKKKKSLKDNTSRCYLIKATVE